MIDFKRLHNEYNIDEIGIGSRERNRRWKALNDQLNESYGVRNLAARQSKYHMDAKRKSIEDLEKTKLKQTGHYNNYSSEELLDIRRLYSDYKIDEPGISTIEIGRRWSEIDKELNEKYTVRESGSRRSKYSFFIKNSSTEQLESYQFSHSRASDSFVNYNLGERKLIKKLAEEVIFDKNGDDADKVMSDYKDLIERKAFNGENQSVVPSSLMLKIDEVDWDSIAAQLNQQFSNERESHNLKRYYMRCLLRFESYDELEEVEQLLLLSLSKNTNKNFSGFFQQVFE